MEKLDFILKQAYYMTGATITEVTGENEIRTIYGHKDADNTIVPVGTNRIEEIVNVYHGSKPEVMNYDSAVYYLIFRGPKDSKYIIGPLLFVMVSFKDMVRYRRDNGIKDVKYKIPVYEFGRATALVSIIHMELTGEMLPDNWIWDEYLSDVKVEANELEKYELENVFQERSRVAYEEEMQFLNGIEQGKLPSGEMRLSPENVDMLSKVGIFTKDNDGLKQAEITFVSGIVLATRAAIRGGVPPFEMYTMSDIFLQKMTSAQNIMDMIRIYIEACNRIVQAVNEAKSRKTSDLVETCKKYIERHRNGKIVIADMARELGKSQSYLARRFHEETGTTLQQYALNQRLEAGANMLKFSDERIGDIAEYLGFSSQSHFSNLFMKKYGQSPAEYRRQNKIIDFKE
ncbi:MAG: helix-turn-helix domain-containing protein [Lachnospiraceae bacterium]|nr:helix-turn-helix domain-containing protein [Lachnospiraceae bacterium]